jgi:haloacetate dehalogenase
MPISVYFNRAEHGARLSGVFEGFTEAMVDVDGLTVFVRHGGAGPAVLLLHGHPRTSATWHRVAPVLVEAGMTVVCADLPGYGRSGKPIPTADHALDFSDRVRRVVLMDCLPISEHLDRTDARFATAWWHWFFFAQPDIPERVINADPDAWYHGDPTVMGAENYDEWRAAMRDPDVVRGMVEDYRAGLSIDAEHERQDRAAARRVEQPLLVLWSLHDDLEDLYGDPLSIWHAWADDVTGHGIDSGHHMAEEAPHELADALSTFLRPWSRDPR